jgi:uncharacterized protein (TIGR02678 family)
MSDRQQRNEHEERTEAIRILLTKPLLPAEAETFESFRLVRRHSDWLRQWFQKWPAWTLHVTADVARLRKTPSPQPDSTRGLLDRNSSNERLHFSRRRYALLCLVLAMLENEQRQTTIQRVAQKTVDAIRINPALREFDFDPRLLAHRYELIAVMRFLQRIHVLIRADGDDSDYVGGEGDCLYRIDRSALAHVPGSVRGASTVSKSSIANFIEKLNEVETPESSDARNRELQNLLVRRLLDDPIMYFDDLTVLEYEYFNKQGERLLREMEHVTGLIAERRAEGIALLDKTGEWTDLGLPEMGTRGHATLLLAEWLANGMRESAEANYNVSTEEVRQHVADLAAEHESRWRKDSNTTEGIRLIAEETVEILHALSLVQVAGERIFPRHAIARYRLDPVRVGSFSEDDE